METVEATQPIQPTEQKSTNWPKIILAAVVGFGLLAGAAYAGYYYGIQQTPTSKPTPTVADSTCNQNEDCVLAINLDVCCGCPKAASRKGLQENENLVKYEFGKDYSEEIRSDCKDVVCAPCAPWNKVICEAGECKGVFERAKED